MHRAPPERGPSLGEEQPEGLHALVHDGAAPHVAGVGEQGLVLLPVGAGSHPEDHSSPRELVERGHLLGEHRHVAHGQHDDAVANLSVVVRAAQ